MKERRSNMGISGINGVSSYDAMYPSSKTKAVNDVASQEEMMQVLSQKIEEIQTKLENGDTEESFAIGGSEFTLDEWESLIDKFDAVQETVREEQQERTEKLKAEQIQEIYENKEMDDAVADSLVSESIFSSVSTDEGTAHYITWSNENGIFCREAGQTTGYYFEIPFDDVSETTDPINTQVGSNLY
jgi:hypothetical protein